MTKSTAVLLMAYGGPDSLDDVTPYLADVRRGRPTPPELIEEITARYAAIGGKSPLLAHTQKQAAALENQLNSTGNGNYRVFIGMRHWKPAIREAVAQIRDAGFDRITALCMTPFSSSMSTGAYFEKLDAAVEELYPDKRPVIIKAGAWYDNPAAIQALADRVEQGLHLFNPELRDQVQVIFTAHSLPAVIRDQGDPYPGQFEQMAEKVAVKANLLPGRWTLGYQSAGAASMPWLGPSLEEIISQADTSGKRNLLVAPIGFLTDHVEILYDIDIEAKNYCAQLGIHLERTPSLNDDPDFIRALSKIIFNESQSVGNK